MLRRSTLRLEPGRGGTGSQDQPRLQGNGASGSFLFVQRSPGTSFPPLPTTRSFDKPSFYFQQHPATYKHTPTKSHRRAKKPSNIYWISAGLRHDTTHTHTHEHAHTRMHAHAHTHTHAHAHTHTHTRTHAHAQQRAKTTTYIPTALQTSQQRPSSCSSQG